MCADIAVNVFLKPIHTVITILYYHTGIIIYTVHYGIQYRTEMQIYFSICTVRRKSESGSDGSLRVGCLRNQVSQQRLVHPTLLPFHP